jgi:hypothetical protein
LAGEFQVSGGGSETRRFPPVFLSLPGIQPKNDQLRGVLLAQHGEALPFRKAEGRGPAENASLEPDVSLYLLLPKLTPSLHLLE